MKWEIKGKSNVHLVKIGKVLSPGQIDYFEGDELPAELINAKNQGLISIKEHKVEEKVEPAEPELVIETPKEEEEIVEEVLEDIEEETVEEDAESLFPPLPKDIDDMYRSELDRYGESIGLNPKDYSTKDAIRDVIRKMLWEAENEE